LGLALLLIGIEEANRSLVGLQDIASRPLKVAGFGWPADTLGEGRLSAGR
jgi:hypothetical protein